MEQLIRLTKPFPAKLVKAPPKGKYGSYVEHSGYNQALLAVVGPFSFKLVQTLRGEDNRIEGCIAELTVTIDGREVSVQEAGDCEQPGNWKTQGARMKDASSDAFKRCCMRLGLGLHLWADDDYILHDLLLERAAPKKSEDKPSGTTP